MAMTNKILCNLRRHSYLKLTCFTCVISNLLTVQEECCVTWSHVAHLRSTRLWRRQNLPLAIGAKCLGWRGRGSWYKLPIPLRLLLFKCMVMTLFLNLEVLRRFESCADLLKGCRAQLARYTRDQSKNHYMLYILNWNVPFFLMTWR